MLQRLRQVGSRNNTPVAGAEPARNFKRSTRIYNRPMSCNPALDLITTASPARSSEPGAALRCSSVIDHRGARATRACTRRPSHVHDRQGCRRRHSDAGNSQRGRLVQIDTPEVYFGAECYGLAASGSTKRLPPIGTRVRLLAEPATDRVDQYGRLLRYVIRVRDGLDVNVRLVAVGAAAPYFYDGRRGRYANRHDPYRGVATGR